jgi:ketol-acid reductoisomerase
VNAETRKTMKNILAKIQSGEFAQKWIAENKAGLPEFNEDAPRRNSTN